MRKRRAGGTAALVLLSLLAGCGASGPEVAGSGLEEVLWRVDAPLETGEMASLLENSQGQRLLLVGEETVLEVDAPFGQDTQVLTPDLDGDGREEVVLVSEAGPEGEITLSGVWWDGAGWRELSGPDEPPTVALEEPSWWSVKGRRSWSGSTCPRSLWGRELTFMWPPRWSYFST